MARSYRRTPIIGNLSHGPGTMKAFRSRTTKRLRQATQRAIARAAQDFAALDVLDPRTPNAVIERWIAPDDGRTYIGMRDDRSLLRK